MKVERLLVTSIVEDANQIDVDGTVGIDAVDRFFSTTEGAFDGLGGREDGERGESRLDSAAEVAERMVGLKAPGFGIKERRHTLHGADLLSDEFDGSAERLLAFAEVTSQRQIIQHGWL